MAFENGLVIEHTSNATVIDTSTPSTSQFLRTDISSANVPFMEIHSAGLYAFLVANGFGFRNAGSPVINVASDAPAYGAVVVFSNQGGQVENNVLSSDVPIVWGYLIQSTLVGDNSIPTMSGLDGASINFAESPNHIFNAAESIRLGTAVTGLSETVLPNVIQELVDVGVTQVVHGSDNTVTRPSGWAMVIWIGSVEPDNIATNDLWIDNS